MTILDDIFERLPERIMPDGVVLRSPAALERSVVALIREAYEAGRDEALAELRTAGQVALDLGIAPNTVRELARRRGVGWCPEGRVMLFRPADVDALRDRRMGRPRTATDGTTTAPSASGRAPASTAPPPPPPAR